MLGADGCGHDSCHTHNSAATKEPRHLSRACQFSGKSCASPNGKIPGSLHTFCMMGSNTNL